MVALAYTPVPVAAQPGVIFALVYLWAYFRHIVSQNYRNAYEVR